MPWPEPVTLRGTHAIIEPLSPAHHDELVEAVQDGELWQLWYTVVPEPDKMRAEIDRRLDLQAKGAMLAFAVRDTRTARVVGMTSYWNVDAANRRVEIGGTWYRKSMQRTPLNTECKLLLAHACVRIARVHLRGAAHTFLQPRKPACHRAPGRQARWHFAQQPDSAQRDHSRHLRLQHHCRRVANGESASFLATGPAKS